MSNIKILISLTDAQVEKISRSKKESERVQAIAEILVELGRNNKKLLQAGLKERLFNLLFVLKDKYFDVYALQDLNKYKLAKFNRPLLRKAFELEFFRVVSESEFFLSQADLDKINIGSYNLWKFSIRSEGRIARPNGSFVYLAKFRDLDWFNENAIDPALLKRSRWLPAGNIYFTRSDQITEQAARKKVKGLKR